MKSTVTLLMLFLVCFCKAQVSINKDELQLNSLKIEVRTHSLKELKAIKMSDFKSILNTVKPNSDLEFNLICKSDKVKFNEKISYRIKGNSSEKRSFIKLISKLKRNAKHYYKNNG